MQHNGKPSVPSWRAMLDIVTTVAMLCAAVMLLWINYPKIAQRVTAKPAAAVPKQPVPVADALVEGDATAKAGMIVFSEFQCPYCARFSQQTLPALREKYVKPGLLRIAFRHFPLESIHDKAFKAAEALECANDQGKWLEMHDLLFAEPKSLEIDHLHRRAETLELDTATYRDCLSTGRSAKVRGDMEAARQMGVSSTPTFLIGRFAADGRLQVSKRINGAKAVEEFAGVLDGLVAQR